MGLCSPAVLIVSLTSIFFFYPAEALCVPRTSTNPFDLLQGLPQLPNNVVGGVVDPAIIKACNATDFPRLCLSSIKPLLHGKADLVTILDDEIKACKKSAIAASVKALKIAKDPKTNNATASSLQDCYDSYKDALDNLQSAEDAIKSRDIGTINSMLSAAVTDFGDCDDDASETPGSGQPMTREDATLQQLASNCLAIASLVKW